MPPNSSTPSTAAKSLTAADIDATFGCDDESPAVTLESLAGLPQWVAWREELRKGKDKPTKVPYNPGSDRKASSTDPTTWRTRVKAEARARMLAVEPGFLRGVGFVLGTLLDGSGMAVVGIDLDASRNPNTGQMTPWAAEIMARLPTYTEVSPSGTGVKLFGLVHVSGLPALHEAFGKTAKGEQQFGAKWTRGEGEHPPGVEFYVSARYFTVTGNREGEWTHLRQLDPADLVALIGSENARKAPPKPKVGPGAAGDQSRSGRALALAGKLRRGVGTREDFGKALAADPELSAWAQDARQVERAWARAAPDGLADLEGFSFDEDGVALAFAARHRNELRFDHHAGRWFRWTGTHWKQEETRLAFAWSRDICRDMRIADAKDPAIRALAKAATAAAVERFAQSDRAFAVTSELWDRDPWLLGTPGGTVELRTGILRPARQADHITKLAAVAPASDFDPDLDCPLWLAFLKEATSNDIGLIRFLQQWCGYCLTGDTREHALLFIHGPGGNGKGVFLNTLTGIFCDYCRTAGMDVFSASKGDRHTQELARLKGARMVCASETEQGRAWAEVRIKQLTGGDTITARFMRQDDFEFRPEFKLTIIGNSEPVLRNVDDAARRRFNVVPFDHKPAKPDPMLEEKLRAEWPGVLAWMIAGCLDWQAHGLQRPAKVMDATAEYFEGQDVLGQWLAEECEFGEEFAATNAAFWASWTRFVSAHGENTLDNTAALRAAMKKALRTAKKEFGPAKDTHGIRGRGFHGLRPRQGHDDDLDPL